ncbi:MAG: PspC domain-containing protein, partial [Chitinophagales bacterium]
MNKTLSINLNSLVFQIDEIAYEKLSNYLKAIANRFEGMEGADEITSDIEARIAEMFSEKLSNTKQVISLADVESVIEVMGRPEDFETIEDELEADPAATKGKKSPRKLFRDTENSIVGGVCSGISAYLGISDPIFLRLIFLIAFFGFGSGFLLYIILWIVIPEAKTASDKLHMRGEAINVSNIEKTIKEEFDNIKKNIDGNQSA